jgi:hypothetical protein
MAKGWVTLKGDSNNLLLRHFGHVILKMLEILLMAQKYEANPEGGSSKSYFLVNKEGYFLNPMD